MTDLGAFFTVELLRQQFRRINRLMKPLQLIYQVRGELQAGGTSILVQFLNPTNPNHNDGPGPDSRWLAQFYLVSREDEITGLGPKLYLADPDVPDQLFAALADRLQNTILSCRVRCKGEVESLWAQTEAVKVKLGIPSQHDAHGPGTEAYATIARINETLQYLDRTFDQLGL